jgi:hypothetical protein
VSVGDLSAGQCSAVIVGPAILTARPPPAVAEQAGLSSHAPTNSTAGASLRLAASYVRRKFLRSSNFQAGYFSFQAARRSAHEPGVDSTNAASATARGVSDRVSLFDRWGIKRR